MRGKETGAGWQGGEKGKAGFPLKAKSSFGERGKSAGSGSLRIEMLRNAGLSDEREEGVE